MLVRGDAIEEAELNERAKIVHELFGLRRARGQARGGERVHEPRDALLAGRELRLCGLVRLARRGHQPGADRPDQLRAGRGVHNSDTPMSSVSRPYVARAERGSAPVSDVYRESATKMKMTMVGR